MINLKKFIANLVTPADDEIETVKRSQWLTLGVFIVLVVGIMTVIFLAKQKGKIATSKKTNPAKIHHIDFTRVDQTIDQQQIWIAKSENEMNRQARRERKLEHSQVQSLKKLSSHEKMQSEQQKEIKLLKQSLEKMKRSFVSQKKEDATRYAQLMNMRAASKPLAKGRIVSPAVSASRASGYYGGPVLSNFHVSLTSGEAAIKKPKKTPKTWMSAGGFITAVVLQGVDAAAGVISQSEPRPVLLRTISRGTLPGNHHSHLKNCLIIGSGYGDISSERVYVRLETMSCINDGKSLDYNVFGYISGTDALTGQRGNVVFKDGAFVSRAFWGGFLSGIGNVGKQFSQTSSISALGSVSKINVSKLPVGAAGNGLGTAGQMYAQYNIKRAEQYQPVVEFSAGQTVNVVFTKGFWLDGSGQALHKLKKVKKNHAPSQSGFFESGRKS